MRTEALKKAQAEYQKKLKRVVVRFSPTENELYESLLDKAQKAGLSQSSYLKRLLEDED